VARRVIETEEQAKEAALAALARRSRTKAELEKDLLARGVDPEMTRRVVDGLPAQGLLDDARLAADEARGLLDRKGLSPDAAASTLVARGLAESAARQAVDAARDGRTDAMLCDAALRRRLHGRPIDPSAVEREARAMTRLGWDADLAARTLEKALRDVERALETGEME